MSPTVDRLFDRIRRYVHAWLLLSRSSVAGLLRVGWMLLLSPLQIPFALSTPLRLGRFRRLPGSLPELALVSPGIWRTPSPTPRADGDAEPAFLVLQYTGSGESVHAAYETTRRLFAAEPRFAGAIHYVFEAPLDKGAYYGPEPFAASLWERVQPIVAHFDGPFVLVGLSRGALVALEHGMRIVEEHGKMASVLALSAPIEVPRTIPRAIATIAGFVEALEGFQDGLHLVPRFLGRFVEGRIHAYYVQMVALILRFHGVFSIESLERHALDTRDHGVTAGSLKASREFRLLVRTSERKLRLLCQLVTQALARHPGRFFAALVWGADDRWIDAESCRRRFQETAARSGSSVAPCTAVVAGQGHLLRGGDRATELALHGWFTRVALEAQRLASTRDVRAEAARGVENELHMASDVRREHE